MNDSNGLFGHLLEAGGVTPGPAHPHERATARTAVAERPAPDIRVPIDALQRALGGLTLNVQTARATFYEPMFADSRRFNRWWETAHDIWMRFNMTASPLADGLRAQLDRIEAARQTYAEAFCRVAETLFAAGNVAEIEKTMHDAEKAASAGQLETVLGLAWHARAEIDNRFAMLNDAMFAFVAYLPMKLDLLDAFLTFDRITATASTEETPVVC